MHANREVIVVASDNYKNLARELTHNISKQPGCNSAYWTIKQYEDNEFQLGGSRFVILIGDSKENPLTNAYLPVIDNLKNEAGACYGFDGTKAVIYGEGRLDQIDNFNDFFTSGNAIISSPSTIPVVSAGAAIVRASTIFSPVSIVLTSGPGLLLSHILKKRRIKRLKNEQTKAALTLFLTKHFDEWIDIKA